MLLCYYYRINSFWNTAVLERIKIRPYEYVKKLSGYRYFRLRVGYYRLILDINNKQLMIIVIEIGHRKNIYKNRIYRRSEGCNKKTGISYR